MFTYRLARERDVPAIMEIMGRAYEALDNKSLYITDDADYVGRYVRGEGFVLLAEDAERPVGFFLASAPGLQDNNLGRYLGFSEMELLGVMMMDSSAVLPEYQGKGVMGELFRRAVALSRDYPFLLGTVAPGNLPSRRNFEKNGFTLLKTVVKPGGQTRLLMGRGIPVGDAAPTSVYWKIL